MSNQQRDLDDHRFPAIQTTRPDTRLFKPWVIAFVAAVVLIATAPFLVVIL